VTWYSKLEFSSFESRSPNSKLENPKLLFAFTPNLELLIEQFLYTLKYYYYSLKFDFYSGLIRRL